MNIALLGGCGYVGSVLVPQLLKRGYKVTVFDLLWFGNALPEQATVIQKNILDLVPKDFDSIDVVVFIAGVSNDPMAEYSPAINFMGNSAAPAYAAYLAKQCGIRRFVYACSCSIYGYTAGEAMTEEALVCPSFPYGISKLQGENAVMLLKDENFRPISLRKGTIFGWSPRMRYDLVVNTMLKCALIDQKIIVHNPGQWRPLISITDVAQAYIRAIEADLSISGIYNISYDNYTIGRLADEVIHALKSKICHMNINLEIQHKKDIRNYKVNTDKAKLELDFIPSQSPVQAIEIMIEHIETEIRNDNAFTLNNLFSKDNIEKFKYLNNDEYYNIKVFKKL